MTVRDLGYRAYEGERLPPSRNLEVLYRYGLLRTTASWVTRGLAVLCLAPPLVAAAVLGGAVYVSGGQAGDGSVLAGLRPAVWMRVLLSIQLWCFAFAVSTVSGAGILARDRTHRAYQFYFAKPVTPAQYLTSRVTALTTVLLALLFVPMILPIGVLTALGGEEAFEYAGYLFPAAIYSVLVAFTLACGSIGASALSRSPALTLTAWVVAFAAPHVLTSFAFLLGGGSDEWQSIFHLSLPGNFGIVASALFKVAEVSWQDGVKAAAIILAFDALALLLAWRRIAEPEVIA
jgi:ABC-type transport system involved in multi-copper enzyme maturation permease subunit